MSRINYLFLHIFALFCLVLYANTGVLYAQETPKESEQASETLSEDLPTTEESTEEKTLRSLKGNLFQNKKDAPAKEKTSPKEQAKDKPRFGRDAPPLEEIVITPPELPQVVIPLPTTPQENEKEDEDITSNLNTRITPPRSTPILIDDPQVLEPDPVVQEEPSIKEIKAAPEVPSPPVRKTLHDVHFFKLAGVSLGMTPEVVKQTLIAHGFHLTKGQYGIPLYRIHRYKKLCKQRFTVLTEINACVQNMAQHDKVYYTAWFEAVNPLKKEAVKAVFTSHATGNKLYKFYYETKGDTSLGWGIKSIAYKHERKDGFWNLLFNLYGYPDDPVKFVWGDLEHAYMQATMAGTAYNGYIVLADKDLAAEDYFAAEDYYKESLKPSFLPSSLGIPKKDEELY